MKKSHADLRATTHWIDSGPPFRGDRQTKESQIPEALKQHKVERKKTKVTGVKERSMARRARLEVCRQGS